MEEREALHALGLRGKPDCTDAELKGAYQKMVRTPAPPNTARTLERR